MLLQLLTNIAAFLDGFLYGLSDTARQERSEYQIALLPAAPAPLLLPPAREPLTPVEMEIITMAETVHMERDRAALAQPRLIEFIDSNYLSDSEPEPQPQMSRADLVAALLDEAWTRGFQTYNALIDYVKEHSGEGCSRRIVSEWKKARKLTGDQEQAA